MDKKNMEMETSILQTLVEMNLISSQEQSLALSYLMSKEENKLILNVA